jgi:hypothetical protein
MPKLPKTAPDGMEVADPYGSIWRYDSQLNAWVEIGTIGNSSVVTETKDGLMSPAIFSRVNAISDQVQNGLAFDYLKIYPYLSSYYYLFQSTNNTITFEPESSHDLRIEISRPRLLSLLSQLKCPGEQGPMGDQGDVGIKGTPGEPETKYAATIVDNILSIDVSVDNSLGTPISLRLFAGQSSIPSVIIKVVDSEYEIVQSSIEINLESTYFDYYEGQLTGQISSSSFESSSWFFKALQMGKKGPDGAIGHNFLQVISDEIGDETLVSNTAVILLRQGDGIGVLNYLIAELFKTNCVSQLAVSHLCSTTTTSLADAFAALQVTTDSCKNITRYDIKPVVAEIPDLVFSEWTPTTTCLRQHHFTATRLSWMDHTKVGSDMVPWQRANEPVAGDPGYPWSIVEESDPGQMCCQEDFFFCSNVNDVTGACPVAVVSGIQTPEASVFDCNCDCPISFLLEGGYEFEDVRVVNDGDYSSQIAVCSINGGLHEYNITINVSTTALMLITVTWKVEYDSICNEARELYLSQNTTIPCSPIVLGTFDGSQSIWDLSQFQGQVVGFANGFWRMIAIDAQYSHEYPWYGAGCIKNGILIDLPANWKSPFSYTDVGDIQLQVGCLDEGMTQIIWPGTAATPTPVYTCQTADVVDGPGLIAQENCPISWLITDKSTQTEYLSRQKSDTSKSLSSIGDLSFSFEGTSGAITVSANINTARLNCCLGYRVTVSVTASEIK